MRLAALVPCCLALAAVTAAGCGGDDGPTDLPPLAEDGTVLEAGEYQTTKFKPQTTFKVEDGWVTASTEVRDYFDFVRDKDAFEGIAFQRVAIVAAPRAKSTPVPAPRNLVSWIRNHPRLTADPPKKTTVDGQPATQVDARVKSAPPHKQQPSSCERPCLPLFHPSDGRPVSYELGDALRFVIVKARRGEVPVTITIATTGANFGRFVPQAEKVLSTVKFAKD